MNPLTTKDIFKLQSKNNEQKLKCELKKSKHELNMSIVNIGVFTIVKNHSDCLFAGMLRKDIS